MIVRLYLELLDVEPLVWRRLDVSGDATLADLHEIVQRAMGWQDSHLHAFEIDGVRHGAPDPDDFEPIEDERRTELRTLAVPGAEILYEYDFGDGWMHVLTIEATRDESPKQLAVCVAGDRACPPEDCGGPWGYQELIDALADPAHERHDELHGWVPRGFDAGRFERDRVNRELARLGPKLSPRRAKRPAPRR